MTFDIDFWGGGNSVSTANAHNVRSPEELIELHPESMTDEEREYLEIEKISAKKAEERSDTLDIHDDSSEEKPDTRYLVHNPPIQVSSE